MGTSYFPLRVCTIGTQVAKCQCSASSPMTLGLSQHLSWVSLFSCISLPTDSVMPGPAFRVSAEIGPSVPLPPIVLPMCPRLLVLPSEKKRIQLLGNRLCALRGCFSLEKVSSRHGEWGSGTDGCLTADRQHWLSSLEHWPPSSSVFPRYCILLPFLRTALLGSSCIYLQAYMLRLLVFFFTPTRILLPMS